MKATIAIRANPPITPPMIAPSEGPDFELDCASFEPESLFVALLSSSAPIEVLMGSLNGEFDSELILARGPDIGDTEIVWEGVKEERSLEVDEVSVSDDDDGELWLEEITSDEDDRVGPSGDDELVPLPGSTGVPSSNLLSG